jgi:formiminotetrahydrofolate cyclodeaminase
MQVSLHRSAAEYLDRLASSEPAPGGGSVAALAGALGAALLSMVCNLTVGKEKYRAVEAEIKDLLAQTEALRGELSRLAEQDAVAYGKVAAAYKMARDTEQQRAERAEAIQVALQESAQVPLAAARACFRILELAGPVGEKGNVNVISDVGVAAALAEAGFQCAALNVEVNLAGVKDEGYNERTRAEIAPLLSQARTLRDTVWQSVERAVAA